MTAKQNTWPVWAVALAVITQSVSPAAAPDDGEFPFVVSFEVGAAEFAPEDRITVTEVRGTKAAITTGEIYRVVGNYTLASREEAELALFVTTTSSDPVRIDPKQRLRIKKGSGTFRLVKSMTTDGFMHVSFYPVPSGNEFGGVYFGQGEWVLRKKNWGQARSGSASPNLAIYEYIGDPVSPPVDLNAAYSRAGLMRGIELAAQNARISLKGVDVDDSEFPFLVGVVSQQGDFDKLVEQLRKLKEYDYNGSVGSDTHHAFNMVPYRTFPAESSQRIGRRMTLRQQILFDKIITSR